MELTWLGHSCFRLTSGDHVLIIDPYQPGSVPGLTPLTESAHEVLCTHGHADHSARDAIGSLPAEGPSPFKVSSYASWHDERQGRLRGANTIFEIRCEGLSSVHLGDLGCMPGSEVITALHRCDVQLIPVGGYYTIDGAQAVRLVRRLEPALVIPMHFRTGSIGYEEISTAEDFLSRLPSFTCMDSSSLTLPQRLHAGCICLSPLHAAR